MRGLFGTDGVRGRANGFLTPELAVALARATAARLVPSGGSVIIGRDTRVSGPMLEAALTAGFASAGVDVYLAGIISTPAISFLIKDERADLGAVISASHNPPQDNGIKFFDRHGLKLSLTEEEVIEATLDEGHLPSDGIGTITPLEAAATRYAAFLTGAIDVEQIDFTGSTIIVDCAFGATATIAPRVFKHLKATVIPLHDALDGTRINQDCGSTNLGPLREAVLARHADLGIAFDGDGDRVMLIASDGSTIDGDRMMGIAAAHMHEPENLSPPAIVTTIMSNLGLERWLNERGIRVIRTPVGDRHVSHAMVENGIALGGEPSGHIIFSEFSPTGDGILTAVKLLEIAHRLQTDLGVLAKSIPLYPQVLRNVPCPSPIEVIHKEEIQATITAAEAKLKPRGRIVVRPSGTQPVIRVMVEAEDPQTCVEGADALHAAIRQSTTLTDPSY